MNTNLNIGDKAPDFNLLRHDKKIVNLSNYSGKWLVLYAYPKDNTSGCTLESIEFSQMKSEFDNLDAVVVGISPDDNKSHCKFIDKHSLDVDLLSDDEEKSTLTKYGVWKEKSMYGKKYMGVVRSTFIISPEGKIAYIFYNIKADEHAKNVFEKLKELKS